MPHWELGGVVYFITFNAYEKLELAPEARQVVIDACLFFNDQRYKVYALVVMPDHVHLLIQPLEKPEGEFWSLSSILHTLKGYTAKQIPKVMKHIGIIWQESRYDRIIRDEEEFQNTWEYIRQNSVKAGLSNTPEEYPFFYQISAFNHFPVGRASCPTTLDQTDEKLISNTVETTVLRNGINIVTASADNLSHITDNSVDTIVTDPPYYATIQYAELSDFFYVWQKRTLGDIFPELFASELTDKDREAIANPSRFRNMGISPEVLANQDYEAKMALAFAEYYRVLRDDGVMTVQFRLIYKKCAS